MIFLSLYFFGQIFGRKFIFFFLLVFFLFLSFLFLVWSSFGFFLLFKMHKSSRGVVSNWAANVPLVSENAIVAPKSTAHLQEIIKHCAKGGRSVKVLGAGHSSSRIGQTRCGNGVALDMKHFQEVISVTVTEKVLRSRPELRDDKLVTVGNKCSVKVQTGMSLYKVYNTMARYGMRPMCPAILLSQTVAGALSTATHGHGVHSSSISGCLLSVKAVDGRGEIVEVKEGEDYFPAWQVHLGVLGVLVEAEVKGEMMKEKTLFKQVHYDVPVDCLTGDNNNPESIWKTLASGEYNKIWYFPKHHRFHLFKLSETTDEDPTIETGEQPSLAATTFDWPDARTFPWTLTKQYDIKNPHEPKNLPISTDLKSPVVGTAFSKRIDHLLCVPDCDATVHPQVNCELCVPFQNASEALKRVFQFFEAHPELMGDGSLVDIRPLAVPRGGEGGGCPEGGWLAPAGVGGTMEGVCYFGFLEYHPFLEREEMFLGMQDLLAPLGCRPHWGKKFDKKNFNLEKLYPSWSTFWEYAHVRDPNGVFRNEYVEELDVSPHTPAKL